MLNENPSVVFVKTGSNQDQYYVCERIDQLCGGVSGRWTVVRAWAESSTVCYEIKSPKVLTLIELGALNKLGKLVTYEEVQQFRENHFKLAQSILTITGKDNFSAAFQRRLIEQEGQINQKSEQLKNDIESCFLKR